MGGDAAKVTDFSFSFPVLFRFRIPNPSALSSALGGFDFEGLGGSESLVFVGLIYDTRVLDDPIPGTYSFEGVVETDLSLSLEVTRMPFEGDFDKGEVVSISFSNVWDLCLGIDIGLSGRESPGEPGMVDPTESNVLALCICTDVGGIMGELTAGALEVHRSSMDVFFCGSERVLSGVGKGLVSVEDSRSALALIMFCTKPRPWRRLRLGVAPFGGVLSEKAGDLLMERMVGPCSEGFGFGSTGRASVGVLTAVAGRKGLVGGEGLRRRFGAGRGGFGDLDLTEASVLVRPDCEMDGNVVRGRPCLTSLLSGPGVYECRCKFGVEDAERLWWDWGRGGDSLCMKFGAKLGDDGLDELVYLCRLGPGPEGVLIVRSRMCSRTLRSFGNGEGLGELSDSTFST